MTHFTNLLVQTLQKQAWNRSVGGIGGALIGGVTGLGFGASVDSESPLRDAFLGAIAGGALGFGTGTGKPVAPVVVASKPVAPVVNKWGAFPAQPDIGARASSYANYVDSKLSKRYAEAYDKLINTGLITEADKIKAMAVALPDRTSSIVQHYIKNMGVMPGNTADKIYNNDFMPMVRSIMNRTAAGQRVMDLKFPNWVRG